MTNSITISGKISDLKVSHTTHNIRVYEMTIEYERLSGRVDTFKVYFDDRFAPSNKPYALVKGDLRERTIGNESVTVIHAYEISFSDMDTRTNYVELEGTLKRASKVKYSKGIPYVEIVVKCDRNNGYKTDYIPCVVWGMDSLEVYDAEPGDGTHLFMVGRLQNKKFGTQVSVRSMEWR